jgi:PAS domain-containing protein
MASATSRHAKVHWSLEQAVVGLSLLGGLPAAVALVWIIWGQNYSFEVRWTLAAVVLVVWVGCAAASYQMVTRVLYLAANLLGALHEGDYSIRGTGAKPGSAADLVMKEINSLGNTLQRQRSEAVESTALLASVMGAIDVAVFAFDMDEKLVLANPAAEKLLNKRSPELLGHEAGTLRLEKYLTGDTPRLIEGAFGPANSRLDAPIDVLPRRQPHLLVFADLSRALREQQQQAWQGIVRVLSHEINNSLTPIKSIAHSIKRMISRVPDIPRAAEIQDGLNLIETRSGALGRFLRATPSWRGCRSQQRPIQIAAGPPAGWRTACRSGARRATSRARPTPTSWSSCSSTSSATPSTPRSTVAARSGSTGRRWTDSFSSPSRTRVRACRIRPTCSCPSSRRSQAARASAWRSAARSPKRTAAPWVWRTAPTPKAAGLFSGSLYNRLHG